MSVAASQACDATSTSASLVCSPDRTCLKESADGVIGNRDAVDGRDSRPLWPSERRSSSHHMEKELQSLSGKLQGLGETISQMDSKLAQQLLHIERKLDLLSEQNRDQRQCVNVYAAQTAYPAPMAPTPAPTPITTVGPPGLHETRTSAFLKNHIKEFSINEPQEAFQVNVNALQPTKSRSNLLSKSASLKAKFDDKMEEMALGENGKIEAGPPVLEQTKTRVSLFAQYQEKQNLEGDETASKGKSADDKKGRPTYKGNLFGDLSPDVSNLEDVEYKVENFYSKTGYCQLIARSDAFQNFTLLVIAVNAIYIGVDADNNTEENLSKADWYFQVCEHSFCVFFVCEWLLRFGAFEAKTNCLRDRWFKFDTGLVVIMVFETWVMTTLLNGFSGIPFPTSMIKLLRLARMARMVRLTRSFPELMAMCKGVQAASRAVGSALLMMCVLVYTFAVVMFLLLKDQGDERVMKSWGSLTISIWTLLIDGTFLDNIGLVSRSLLATDNYIATAVLVLFVLASALTVMNMLIGVLCEVVTKVAEAEKESSAVRMVKENLLTMLRSLDSDDSGMISADEISTMLDDAKALQVLLTLEVDIEYFLDILDMYFSDGPEVSIHSIMDLILRLRGNRPVTVKDLLKAETFSNWKVMTPMAEMPHMTSSIMTALGIDPNKGNGDQDPSANGQ